MPGPAPKPADERARRNKPQVAMRLPAAGRSGPAPKFPLAGPFGDDLEVRAIREREVWAELWRTPQAVAWERLAWTHNVALYCRLLVAAEMGDAKAMPEVRQWADRLGLSPLALLRLQWVIDADEVGERREEKAAPVARARYGGLRSVGGSSAVARP